MQPFTQHRGKLALLDWSDVNTDLIIPARYLKRIERTGYGPLLFADKQYAAGGAPDVFSPETHGPPEPQFPLNAPRFKGATILLVGRNFGCGSSREHAVWAVAQAGYRALIAPGKGEGFADIFEQNALNNGLLPIELPPDAWELIAAAAAAAEPPAEATIDLEANSVVLHHPDGGTRTFDFEIAPDARLRLLKGLDAIAETLAHKAAIEHYEREAPPWTTPAPSTS